MEPIDATALAAELGERLKQARLNRDLTQVQVAEMAGTTRKQVINAEKGKVQLEIFVAIMAALGLTTQLDLFLPRQTISPIELAKHQGKSRQRASRRQQKSDEENPEW
ncbi:helix-turn-helix transcriptional regulator [Biformimicrobium ophioploci]|uniref:HTH cro/C1-type domain-containing protein n=1 Tax=Biformimicrobium ophioploci TaxID=3036711 RepID=A0ABQ6LWU0_9GAMM|nr:helix-turn-helix transcriptional regulator [Microbulbifer sp. NKW57]GMG86576.1 hypothetical protein MNKW57_08970 [Microbulbifer sp. NKW57]